MRKVLILGGTAWLGSAVAQHLMRAGDEVTCLARGEAGRPPTGPVFLQVDRTRPEAYHQAAAQDWDEVIELSHDPQLVNGALAALADRARHWTLVSSVSVYASNSEPGADETAELLEAADLEDYGQAKVAAEQASRAALGERLLIARPGLIAGPGDGSDRFSYWVARFALAGAGAVLTPEVQDRYVQIIDVDDLAGWISTAGRAGVTGVFNVIGHPCPLSEVLESAGEVAGFEGKMISAPDEWLLGREVRYWAGPRSLPLWLPAEAAAFALRSNTAFMGTEPSLTGINETMERVLTAERALGLNRSRRSGLTRDEELDLLNALTSS